jgi:hypothetical protein
LWCPKDEIEPPHLNRNEHVNTIELSADGHAALNDRTFPALEVSEPAEPTMCADISGKSADHLIGLLTP